MTTFTWEESTSACTAVVEGIPVCMIKFKDIGGWTATWLDHRRWAPPTHLPKAIAQESKFFPAKDDAKAAVEQALLAPN